MDARFKPPMKNGIIGWAKGVYKAFRVGEKTGLMSVIPAFNVGV